MYSQNNIHNEQWVEIPEYEGYYEISSLGNVRNIKTNHQLVPFDRNGKGYLTVHLASNHLGRRFKNKMVHSLVAQSFIGDKRKGHVIHHIDGDKMNNVVSNLMYCTQSDNRKFDFIDGRQSFKGNKNNMAKICEDDVLAILFMKDTLGISVINIAKAYNLTRSGINNIFQGHTWAHLTGINHV